AHTGDDGLAGFFVAGHAERRIFLSQTRQGDTHLFLVGLGLGFDSLRDHGLGELHALEQDVLTNVAQRFTGGDVFQTDHGGDVASQNFLDFGTVVGVHLQDAADTFLLGLDRVVHRFTGMQDTRVHAHESQLTDEGVGHELERECRELGVVVGRQADDVAVVIGTFDGRDVDRRGQVIDDGVEHALNTLVLERGTAQHGLDFAGDGAQTQTQVDFGLGQFARFQVLVYELFVCFGSASNQIVSPFVGGILNHGRNVRVLELGALASFIPDDGLHLDEVDHPLESVFSANGDHDEYTVGLQ